MDNYSDIWIGVNYNKTEKKCVNMLNEAVSYTSGNLNGPDNSNHGSNDDIYCVRISSDGIWHAKSCSKTFPALCSQRHTIGKCSECQFKEARWLTNHPSDLPKQIENHISDYKLLFILEKVQITLL